MISSIYKIGLLLVTFAIWYLMYLAKHEEYDLNYGLAIQAFLISLVAVVIIIVLWFKKRDVIKSNKWITIIYLVISSPLSIFLFIELYGRLIGQYFKL